MNTPTPDDMPDTIWAAETRKGVHGTYGSWTTNRHPTDFQGKTRTKNRNRTLYVRADKPAAQIPPIATEAEIAAFLENARQEQMAEFKVIKLDKPAPVSGDVAEAIERVAEFIRQRSMSNNNDVVYIVHADIEKTEARLLQSDLETLIQSAAREAGLMARIEEFNNTVHDFMTQRDKLEDEINHLRAKIAAADGLVKMVQHVHDTFNVDLEQGYKTGDKVFAVSLLGKSLADYTRLMGEK